MATVLLGSIKPRKLPGYRLRFPSRRFIISCVPTPHDLYHETIRFLNPMLTTHSCKSPCSSLGCIIIELFVGHVEASIAKCDKNYRIVPGYLDKITHVFNWLCFPWPSTSSSSSSSSCACAGPGSMKADASARKCSSWGTILKILGE